MMKCKGHIHNERHQGRNEPCNAKLRNVGFERGDNDEIEKLERKGASDESDAVARQIANGIKLGVDASEYAILVRTNAAAGHFELSCIAKGLPVSVIGKSFFAGKERIFLTQYRSHTSAQAPQWI